MRLIDGDKLMMMLADWWYSSFGEEETEESETIYAVMEKVEESLPHMTIEPERKKGRWIYYPKASGSVTSTAVHFYPVCSECGCENPIANYCPNCGADMREGEQDGLSD